MKKYRIALASSQDLPDLIEGEKLLLPALRESGHQVDVCIWDAPEVVWKNYDGVIIRCPWDYYEKLPQFSAWINALETENVHVINDIETLRWNINKSYLFELSQAGLPVIPTELVNSSDRRSLREIFDTTQSEEIVIKPVQSAGAWRTLRINFANLADTEPSFSAWREEQDFLVQPFMPEIVRAGEWSLVFFDGQFSHALVKRAKDGDFRVQSDHGGTVLKADAPASICKQALRILQFLPRMPTYARVDGIVRGDDFLLMELELLEPRLFLEIETLAAHRFATAILANLSK
jgi:glutathione synthase/RimK-type ligase-like ATP-grasp enzyme